MGVLGKVMDVSHPWQLLGEGKIKGEREKGEAVRNGVSECSAPKWKGGWGSGVRP